MPIGVRPDYCILDDVTRRLYGGSQNAAVPDQPNRDALLHSLISSLSRGFDDETDRIPGGFAVNYDTRLYSGTGSQRLEIDECAFISKVEVNTTPGTTPTWVDYTVEFSTGRMSTLPIKTWPKTAIQRISTFPPDPFGFGNVRLTGIFGAVMPSSITLAPTAPWSQVPTLTQAQINALSPDGTANTWWITPERVAQAIAAWTVYEFKAAAAAYGDSAGPNAAPLTYNKEIPQAVKAIIDSYREDQLKLAMIGPNGEDLSLPYGGSIADPARPSRWSGWIASQ